MENVNKRNMHPNFKAMYEELAKAGYPDINDFKTGDEYDLALKSVTRDFDEFIKIVIEWIPKIEYKVGGILLLKATNKKYDGRIIIPVFEESNKQDKWRICDAIVHTPPLYINDWIRDTYLSCRYNYFETGLLPLAIAKMFPQEEARAILKQGFDLHPEVTPEALGKVGIPEDISFLEEKLRHKYDSKFIYKEIEKAIRKINKRFKKLAS